MLDDRNLGQQRRSCFEFIPTAMYALTDPMSHLHLSNAQQQACAATVHVFRTTPNATNSKCPDGSTVASLDSRSILQQIAPIIAPVTVPVTAPVVAKEVAVQEAQVATLEEEPVVLRALAVHSPVALA